MPRLKANTQLYGDYQGRTGGVRSGLILSGEIFDATDEQAEALEARGLACRYMPPRPPAPEVARFVPTYETKVITKRK